MSLDHSARPGDAAAQHLRRSISAAIGGDAGIVDAVMDAIAASGMLDAQKPIEFETHAVRNYLAERPAEYIVLPSDALLDMPQKWQAGFVEYLRKFDTANDPQREYEVTPLRRVSLLALSEEERERFGFEPADDGLHFVRDGLLLSPDSAVSVPDLEDEAAKKDPVHPIDAAESLVAIEHGAVAIAPTSPLDASSTAPAPVVPTNLVDEIEDAVAHVDLVDPEPGEATATSAAHPSRELSFDAVLRRGSTADQMQTFPSLHTEAITAGLAAANDRIAGAAAEMDAPLLHDGIAELFEVRTADDDAAPETTVVTAIQPEESIATPATDETPAAGSQSDTAQTIPADIAGADHGARAGFSMPTPPVAPSMPSFSVTPESTKPAGLIGRLFRS